METWKLFFIGRWSLCTGGWLCPRHISNGLRPILWIARKSPNFKPAGESSVFFAWNLLCHNIGRGSRGALKHPSVNKQESGEARSTLGRAPSEFRSTINRFVGACRTLGQCPDGLRPTSCPASSDASAPRIIIGHLHICSHHISELWMSGQHSKATYTLNC